MQGLRGSANWQQDDFLGTGYSLAEARGRGSGPAHPPSTPLTSCRCSAPPPCPHSEVLRDLCFTETEPHTPVSGSNTHLVTSRDCPLE